MSGGLGVAAGVFSSRPTVGHVGSAVIAMGTMARLAQGDVTALEATCHR
ncbi:MAG: hypothetical protein M3N28_05025 [Actinomycetota bacterium]|nr:hypothetical protein [Actinomycetota bacterium]